MSDSTRKYLQVSQLAIGVSFDPNQLPIAKPAGKQGPVPAQGFLRKVFLPRNHLAPVQAGSAVVEAALGL